MNLNNDKITIVEKPLYLSLDDKQNSWYFDADAFSIDFPLVCSYLSLKSPLAPSEFCPITKLSPNERLEARNGSFLAVYDYMNIVTEYFRRSKDLTAFIYEIKWPNNYLLELLDYQIKALTAKENRGRGSPLWYLPSFVSDSSLPITSVGKLPNRKFTIHNLEKINNVFYLRLMVVAELDLDEIRSYFYHNISGGFVETFPFIQTITTKDWDLVKKYMFFTVRNQTYRNFTIDFNISYKEVIPDKVPEYLNTELIEGVFEGVPNDVRNGDLKQVDRFCVYYDGIA